MNITRLQEDDLQSLFKMIPPRIYKDFYRRNPKLFASIKPGFRASKLTDSDAIALAFKYRSEKLMSDFVNDLASQMLSATLQRVDENSLTMDLTTAITFALADSPFADGPELFYLIVSKPENYGDAK